MTHQPFLDHDFLLVFSGRQCSNSAAHLYLTACPAFRIGWSRARERGGACDRANLMNRLEALC
jgi:hypothetical protein